MNQYSVKEDRNLELCGGHYEKHLAAVMREKLCEPEDVAFELALRDRLVQQLLTAGEEALDALAPFSNATELLTK